MAITDLKVVGLLFAAICVVAALVFIVPMLDSGNIAYHTDGGTLAPETPSNYVEGAVLYVPDPVREGYIFEGWYTDSGYTHLFKGDTTGMEGILNLYAKWSPNVSGHILTYSETGKRTTTVLAFPRSIVTEYTVTGELSIKYIYHNEDKGQYYTYRDETVTLKTSSGKPTTNHDEGYYWEAGGSSSSYIGKETISTIKGDVECVVYTVTYSNGAKETDWIGVSDGIMYKAKYTYSSSSILKSEVRETEYILTSDVEFKVEPTIMLTIDADEGITIEGNKGMYIPGETVTLKAIAKSGEQFRGWFKDTGELITNDETLTFIITEDKSFVAELKKYYNISYELNGGTASREMPSKYSPGDPLEIPSPKNEGLVFAGWALDEGLTIAFNGDTSDFSTDITLYAAWNENLSGHTMTMTKQGYYDRGYNSYYISGELTFTYLYYDDERNSYFIRNDSVTTYDYKYIGNSYTETSSDLYWGSERETTEEYLGEDTIQVQKDGAIVDKVCSVYRLTYPSGATETQWIADGWIVYKIVSEYSAFSVFDIHYYVEYYYKSDGFVVIEDDCDITVVEGEGITVEGNESPYRLGQTATLVAKTDGVVFSGWYDENMNLLETSKEYKFVVGGSRTLYAMNNTSYDETLASDTLIDLNDKFGMNNATYVITNTDTGDVTTSDDGQYMFEDGGVYSVVAKEDDGTSKIFNVMVTGGVTRTFEWKYDRENYTITMDINYEDLLYARGIYSADKRMQASDHVRDQTFVTYSYTDSTMAPYMSELVDELISAYQSKHSTINEVDFLGYLLAFTQYIEYQSDEEYMGVTEYWKFPLETLYDQGGDCEDTSILFVAIAHECRDKVGMSYKVALQLLPGHMAGAIELSSGSGKYSTNPYGYIYGETTTADYAIGDIPSTMKEYFVDQQKKYYSNGYSVTVLIA